MNKEGFQFPLAASLDLPMLVYSHADVLRGSSHVPAPLTSAEPKDKFLSLCLQISAGDHMQIIGEPIGAVEVKDFCSRRESGSLISVGFSYISLCKG